MSRCALLSGVTAYLPEPGHHLAQSLLSLCQLATPTEVHPQVGSDAVYYEQLEGLLCHHGCYRQYQLHLLLMGVCSSMAHLKTPLLVSTGKQAHICIVAKGDNHCCTCLQLLIARMHLGMQPAGRDTNPSAFHGPVPSHQQCSP